MQKGNDKKDVHIAKGGEAKKEVEGGGRAWLAAIAVGQERVPQGGGGGADGRGDSGIKEMTEGAGRDDAGKGAGSRSEAQAGMSCREKRQSQRQQHTGQVFEIPPAYDSLSPSQRTLR
uniref:HDC05823 n=1 Tax=Drosophila melanogaster TaxID=7227 RepID=Q6IGN7_DROME|nr:TPA_inf: HDC05823 [Drosophila melanogaster]